MSTERHFGIETIVIRVLHCCTIYLRRKCIQLDQQRCTTHPLEHEEPRKSKSETRHAITGFRAKAYGLLLVLASPPRPVTVSARLAESRPIRRLHDVRSPARTHAFESRRQGRGGRKRRQNSRPKSPRKKWPRCAKRARSSPSPPSERKNVKRAPSPRVLWSKMHAAQGIECRWGSRRLQRFSFVWHVWPRT